jgi:hypothetical protein
VNINYKIYKTEDKLEHNWIALLLVTIDLSKSYKKMKL